MKRFVKLKDELLNEFECDFLSDLFERNSGEVWIDLYYKVIDKNDKDISKVHRFKRCVAYCKNRHEAYEKIRNFQEILEE